MFDTSKATFNEKSKRFECYHVASSTDIAEKFFATFLPIVRSSTAFAAELTFNDTEVVTLEAVSMEWLERMANALNSSPLILK